MKDFLNSIWVRPVNENGDELSTEDLHRWARRWVYELCRRTRDDDEAKRLLMNLAAETVVSAMIYSENDSFNAHAQPFRDAVYGKQPTQSNQFCEEWLLIGLMHAEGIKTSPQGYDVRDPEEMARLAITALEYTLGKEWQDHESVSRFFDKIKRKTPLGERSWADMDRGERREVVRKTLRTAARTWKRQSNMIRARKSK